MLPANEYVEVRNGGYYIAGTRIGLDVVARDFQLGRSPEAILEAYPAIGSLANVYGVITFVLEHPDAIEAFLKDQELLHADLKAQHPLPPEMVERYERVRHERLAKQR
jgi:uncharacterized protein (DUF433 family)